MQIVQLVLEFKDNLRKKIRKREKSQKIVSPKMHGLTENMFWKYYFVFVSLFVCIYCENWWSNDEVQSYDAARYDHQVHSEHQNQNHHVKSESRRLNGHNRHSFHNEAEIPLRHFQVLSDDPVANGDDSTLPFNEAAVDRKYVRRTNFRRRKISSSNHKKNIFRRGQRHRQNKNGNSFAFSRQQINFFPFSLALSLCSLHNQSKIANRFNLSVREMSLFCPILSALIANGRLVG